MITVFRQMVGTNSILKMNLENALRFFPEWWIGHAVGWPLVVAGVLLSAWSIRTMFRASENPNVYEPTGHIVATGPYAYSRNPIYVAFNPVYAGTDRLLDAYRRGLMDIGELETQTKRSRLELEPL